MPTPDPTTAKSSEPLAAGLHWKGEALRVLCSNRVEIWRELRTAAEAPPLVVGMTRAFNADANRLLYLATRPLAEVKFKPGKAWDLERRIKEWAFSEVPEGMEIAARLIAADLVHQSAAARVMFEDGPRDSAVLPFEVDPDPGSRKWEILPTSCDIVRRVVFVACMATGRVGAVLDATRAEQGAAIAEPGRPWEDGSRVFLISLPSR